MASPAWTIRTSGHRAPRSTRPAAGHRDSRDMSVMADIGWQGLFTVAVIVVTLAMLLWERFSPDRVLEAAAGSLMVGGVLTPAEALTGFRSEERRVGIEVRHPWRYRWLRLP